MITIRNLPPNRFIERLSHFRSAVRWGLGRGLIALLILGLSEQASEAALANRGVYLQTGTPTSVIVRWTSTTAEVGWVKFGTASPPTTQVNEDAPGIATTEHKVTLTGLTPDTKYYYSFGTGVTVYEGSAANNFFVTAPLPGTAKNTRIWILGDSGTGNANQDAVRNAYYTYTGTRHTDLWLMLGDNAYNSGTFAEYDSTVFQKYQAMLRKSVLWPTLGNHDTAQATGFVDTYPYFSIFNLPKQGEAGGVASGSEHYYSFNYGNIHFICLDSMTGRPVSTGMKAWLDLDLAQNASDWTIAFFHHPPYTKGSHDSDSEAELTQMRSNYLPALENSGVDLVLTGHSHSYERSKLINGHYGLSSEYASNPNAFNKDGGTGNGSTPYQKPTLGKAPNEGTVYVVAGSSGQISGGPLTHPVMRVSLNNLGSLVVDVNNSATVKQLVGTFLRENGTTPDTFTIQKKVQSVIVDTVVHASEPSVAGSFTLRRSGGNTLQALPVVFSLSGSATRTADYTVSGASYDALTAKYTTSILANSASRVINITPVADSIVENLETVIVTVEPSNRYNLGAPITQTLNISDDEPPTISVQPQPQTVTAPAGVTFTVTANGTSPLSYEWQFNGIKMSDATGPSLTVPSVLGVHAGGYRVIVSNPFGSVVSQEAALSVNAFETAVVPSNRETTDETFLSHTLDTASRVLQVYPRAQFPKGPLELQGMRFRLDRSFAPQLEGLINNLKVTLSTIPGPSDDLGFIYDPSLDPVFDNNIGANPVTVFDGTVNGPIYYIQYDQFGPLNGPRLFDIYIPFATPFTFQPVNASQGEQLVVDIRNYLGMVDYFTGDPIAMPLSGSSDDFDGAASVRSNDPNAAIGTFSYGADAIQFVYRQVSTPVGQHVLPRQFANGDQVAGAGTFYVPMRSQQVYNSTELPTVPIRITKLRFRPDHYYGTAYSGVPLQLKIVLSSTSKAADGLSTTFANNVGANAVQVFNGTATVSSAFQGPADGPKAFDIEIPLTTAYDYNPSQGNLLIDIFNYQSSPILLSSSGSPDDRGSRMFATGSNPDLLTTGSADTGADAIQLEYTRRVPPAPSVVFAPVNEITGAGTLDTTVRSQQVYHRSYFPSKLIYITGIRFRPDFYYAPPIHAIAPHFKVLLSSTVKAPDGLSATFADNPGIDASTVFDGEIRFATAATGPVTGPKQFDVVVHFKTPFSFNATSGKNLLLETWNYQDLPAWLKLSGSSLSTDNASRLFSTDLNSSTGFADTGADAIEFIYRDYP